MVSNNPSLVSVVTPVYNGANYIRECIESVQAQSYQNWDYSIVDNCSTDGTPEIVEEYASRDSRIRLHGNDKFVRVIENYNRAFRQISPESKYCKVVAADDWLYPKCLEKMVVLAEENPTAAFIGAYGFNGTKVLWQGLPSTITIANGRALCRSRLLGGPYVFGTPSSLLIRSDIIRSRYGFHNEANLHADSEACMEFLEQNDFGFVHEILTFQRSREDSMSSFSREFETYLPWTLYELLTYGPKYLGEKELSRRVTEHMWCYYRYLGEQCFKRGSREIWKFHKAKLQSVGCPLKYSRLVVHAVSWLLDSIVNIHLARALRHLRGLPQIKS